MPEKFKGKHRNGSTRLQNWDYGSSGAYFITICTAEREHYFGEIKNGKMQVSPAGAIANILWYEIKNHAKNIQLGEFVVMPDHVHGIIIIDGNADGDGIVGPGHTLGLQSHPPRNQQSHPRQQNPIGQQRFQNPGKNTISSIVGSYKSAVTKYCNRLEFPFGWQPRFYDHVIRNDESLKRISAYIKNNPAKSKK